MEKGDDFHTQYLYVLSWIYRCDFAFAEYSYNFIFRLRRSFHCQQTHTHTQHIQITEWFKLKLAQNSVFGPIQSKNSKKNQNKFTILNREREGERDLYCEHSQGMPFSREEMRVTKNSTKYTNTINAKVENNTTFTYI